MLRRIKSLIFICVVIIVYESYLLMTTKLGIFDCFEIVEIFKIYYKFFIKL